LRSCVSLRIREKQKPDQCGRHEHDAILDLCHVCGERDLIVDVAMQIEHFCNELVTSRQDVDILCPYPWPFAKVDDEGLRSICVVNSR